MRSVVGADEETPGSGAQSKLTTATVAEAVEMCGSQIKEIVMSKIGLWKRIQNKRERIKRQKAAGKKVERMRKPGSKGAPTAKAFRQSAKTAKKKR